MYYLSRMKLGDIVEKIIRFITFGQGKKIATKIAHLRGKEDCGCDRRQKKLNEFGDKIYNFKELSTPKVAQVDWKDEWKDIRKQVSCSCHFLNGIIDLKDKNGASIKTATFTDEPRIKGKITHMAISYPHNATILSATLKFYTTKDKYTNPVNIKIL